MSQQLIKKLTVEEMIELNKAGNVKFEQALKLQEEVLALFQEAYDIWGQATQSKDDYTNRPRQVISTMTDIQRGLVKAETAQDEQNRCLWVAFIQNTPLWPLMDREEREKMLTSLENENPKFTYEAALATSLHHKAQSEIYYRRGLVNSFRHVVSQRQGDLAFTSRFKSNDCFKLSGKIVLKFYDVDSFSKRKLDRAYHTLCDIERSFLMVDGKELAGQSIADSLVSAYETDRIENDYFEIRIYKNGNIHVFFKRPDLVKKINQEIAAYYGENILADAA